ncbi:MAG: YggS family pyridoxal phosphate-dependent enzyme [Oscillospiraceae bacterium]|jgi:pyridoxal phosphate enzyme (YggS family)|nr:YggS family pyridoxal phosphate-dependent enzyme [Oscillospiraceae bacterium]
MEGIPAMTDDAERRLLAMRVHGIRRALADAARDPQNPPSLLAVTKTVSAERISALPESEIVGIGENRAKEIMEKSGNLVENLRIHMIGRLQTNKVTDIIDRVFMIQSLDRMNLAKEIDRQAGKLGAVARCLVQVNIGHEAQKGGIPPEDTVDTVRAFARLPNLRVEGLMAVLPIAKDAETLRPLFRQMRELFDRLRDEAIAGTDILHLSMGMSGDAIIAAQEGATMVRIGSAIFGARNG